MDYEDKEALLASYIDAEMLPFTIPTIMVSFKFCGFVMLIIINNICIYAAH